MITLGVNLDHVATLRNVRNARYPDVVAAALLVEAHGADGITVHLREDRRHIRDDDVNALKARIQTRLNLEMANTPEMVAIACEVKPHTVTLVPERREELTTEGGLDVIGHREALTASIKTLTAAGIGVSLFVDPDPAQIEASYQVGAPIIELHTGTYCHSWDRGNYDTELEALMDAGKLAQKLGLRLNAGHGLTVANVTPILDLPDLEELNIGHALVADALTYGLGGSIARMKAVLDSANLRLYGSTA